MCVNSVRIYLMVIYRPLLQCVKLFLEEFSSLLEWLASSTVKTLIAGDFNIHVDRANERKSIYLLSSVLFLDRSDGAAFQRRNSHWGPPHSYRRQADLQLRCGADFQRSLFHCLCSSDERSSSSEFGRQRKFYSDPKSEPTLKLSGRISCCWHSSQTRPLMLTGFSTKAVQWRTNQSTGQVCTTRAQHDYGSTGELLEHGGNWNGKEKCSDHGKEVADQANRNRQATASGVP